MTPARVGALGGVAFLLGSCGEEPASTFPKGRYVITEASDERLLGATAEFAGQRLLVTYTDEYGTTYQVKFGEWW